VPEKKVFENPEDRIFFTIDFDGDFMRMRDLAKVFGQEVHAVKLGQAFLLHKKWSQIHEMFLKTGITTYLDIKSHENADQSRYNTLQVAKEGFEYMSVHAAAETTSLKAAAEVSGKLAIVAALSYSSGDVRQEELERIQTVNEQLPEGQGISAIMCNVSQLENTEQLGGVLRIATGIRMPGDSSHDQLAVATPAQALERGADMLAIGRTVTEAPDRQRAFNRVLENMRAAA